MKFYQKNWFIILMMLLFPPLGLFLTWKYGRWSGRGKGVITIVLLGYSFFLGIDSIFQGVYQIFLLLFGLTVFVAWRYIYKGGGWKAVLNDTVTTTTNFCTHGNPDSNAGNTYQESISGAPKAKRKPTARGWSRWDAKHNTYEQLMRMRRASNKEFICNHLDAENGVALFLGRYDEAYETTVDSCDCPDFARRHIPCKHMYYLASQMQLISFDNYLK